MNTKTRKTNNGNTKGEPKSFTPQEVERSALKALAPALELSFTHISLLTEVLTVINLAAIFHNTVHLFKLSTEPNENAITV